MQNNNISFFEGTVNLKSISSFTEVCFNKEKENKILVEVDYSKDRLNERIFYKDNGNIGYIESFKYSNLLNTESIPEEKCISEIYKPNDLNKVENNRENLIGYRFYSNGYDRIQDGYFTLIFNGNNKYDILEEDEEVKDSENCDFYIENLNSQEIIIELFKNDLGSRNPHLISGNYSKSIAFLKTLKNNNKFLHLDFSNLYNIISGNFFNKKTTEQVIEDLIDGIGISEKIIVFPLLMYGHASTLLLDSRTNKKKIYLFDSSLAHCEFFSSYSAFKPKEKFFGKNLSYDITLLNKYPIQTNGSCTYWNYCFLSIIHKNDYDMEKIIREFNTGEMQLKIALEMSKIFDSSNFISNLENSNNSSNSIISEGNNLFFKINLDNMLSFKINLDITLNKFLKLDSFLFSLKDNLNINLSKIVEKLEKFYKMQFVFSNINNMLKNLHRKISMLSGIGVINVNNCFRIFKDLRVELSDEETKKFSQLKKFISDRVLPKDYNDKFKEYNISDSKHYRNLCEEFFKTLKIHILAKICGLESEKSAYLSKYNYISSKFNNYLDNISKLEKNEKKEGYELNKIKLEIKVFEDFIEENEKNSTKNMTENFNKIAGNICDNDEMDDVFDLNQKKILYQQKYDLTSKRIELFEIYHSSKEFCNLQPKESVLQK